MEWTRDKCTVEEINGRWDPIVMKKVFKHAIEALNKNRRTCLKYYDCSGWHEDAASGGDYFIICLQYKVARISNVAEIKFTSAIISDYCGVDVACHADKLADMQEKASLRIAWHLWHEFKRNYSHL